MRVRQSLLVVAMVLVIASRGLAQAPTPAGDIVGTVSDADTGQPVPRAHVTVEVDGTARGADADSQGHFRLLDLPPGTYLLLTIGPGHAPTLQADVVVTAGRQTPVALALAPLASLSEEVLVVASAFSRPLDAATGAHTMSEEEIRRAPGGLGDVSRLAQSLPGAAMSSDQRNDIVARGGSPSENLTIVDGIEVPNLSHFAAQGTSGGPISMLNTNLIQDATFLAGGFSAPYGDRLSSVLDVSLREGSREKVEADVDLGFAGVGATVEGPLGSRGSYLVSARRSYLELLAGPLGLTAIPRYTNYQGKAVIDMSPRQRLSFMSLGGTDRIKFDVDESDLEDPSRLNLLSSGWRTTHGVAWRSLIGDRGIGTFAVSQNVSTFRQSVQDAEIRNETVLEQDSGETVVTAQYDLTYRTSRLGTIKAGALARRLGARFRLDQPIGLDNPFSTDPTRVDAARVRTDLDTNQASLYMQTTRLLSRQLEVTAGARLDHFAFIQATTLSPRLGVVVHLRPNADLNVSYGRYTQMPALVFLSADPVNRALQPMRAEHRVVGVQLRPTAGLKLTVEAYQKHYRHYPVSLEYPTFSLANTGDFYGVGGLLMPLTSAGRGRSRGVEFFVQQKMTHAIYGQIAYSYSRTEHAALDGVPRRGAFDLPHVLTAVGGRTFGRGLELSTKFTRTSGRPTTPFLLDASRAQNRGILDVARTNAERGAAYQRLDVRMDRRFRLQWTNLVTWVEVQNLFGRRNVYQNVWNPKTRDQEAIHQFGRFIVGGFTFEF